MSFHAHCNKVKELAKIDELSSQEIDMLLYEYHNNTSVGDCAKKVLDLRQPKTKKEVFWKCHTPNLLSEIMNNKGAHVLHIPITIFASMLAAVATRASELNDPKLNALMCRMTLYEIADPESKAYDKEKVEEILELANKTTKDIYKNIPPCQCNGKTFHTDGKKYYCVLCF